MRTSQLCRVEGIAFHKLKLPADDFIQGPFVTEDINFIHINTGAFVNDVVDIDGAIFTIPLGLSPDIHKGVSEFARIIGKVVNGFFEVFGVVPVP